MLKKIVGLMLLLMIFLSSSAWAATTGQVSISEHPKVSVLVFLDKIILTDEKAMKVIRSAVSERFHQATIVYYGDNQAKAPEFLEFIEKVQTDSVNEKGIRAISRNDLIKYGKDTNSAYIILLMISSFDRYGQYNNIYDIKQHISVLDVAANKMIEDVAWHKEEVYEVYIKRHLADYFMKVLETEFAWKPSTTSPEEKETTFTEYQKPSVVVFLPDTILLKTESVELVRKTVSAKFRTTGVPIYIDNKPKSAAFLDLISKVESDSTKQRMFVLKKEHLVQYGKDTNTTPVISVNISVVKEDGYSVLLKEDILVVDVESGKYVQNTVFDTAKTMSRPKGIEYLMKKLEEEFRLQVNQPKSSD